MNKKKIFPIICFILFLGAILLTTYFKKLENNVATENARIEMENNSPNLINGNQ